MTLNPVPNIPKNVPRLIKLQERRIKVLELYQKGYTIRAIGKLLNIGHGTVGRTLASFASQDPKHNPTLALQQYRDLNIRNKNDATAANDVNPNNTRLFNILRGKDFYCWKLEPCADSIEQMCFNHAIGLPVKGEMKHMLYDYEQELFDTLEGNDSLNIKKHKHVWVKKATGLGITEFMLRYIAWLCLKDDALSGSRVVIFTGPRLEIAVDIINRMRELFIQCAEDNNLRIPVFDTKETVIEIAGIRCEAFPSHHVDTARGLKNVSFILLEEADFFPPNQQEDCRKVSERYIAKSDPYIVMVSTPNVPEQLFDKIEHEPEETCIYKRIQLDYRKGLGKIFTTEEIQAAMRSPSFEQEYNLKYLGKVGNAFSINDINDAIQEYDIRSALSTTEVTHKSIGIDVGFGSSAFGIVVTEYIDGIVRVIYASQFKRPEANHSDMLNHILRLSNKFTNNRIYVDASASSFVMDLKFIMRDFDYKKYAEDKRYIDNIFDRQDDRLKVHPVVFSKTHRQMLSHVNDMLQSHELLIDPSFTDLIVALRTAQVTGVHDWDLNKNVTVNDDLLDALRLALILYTKPTQKSREPFFVTAGY